MKSTIKTIGIFAIFTFVGMFAGISPVSASDDIDPNAPKDCPVVGPYNVCVPDTGIIDEDGNVDIVVLGASMGVFIAGTFLYVNGKSLKRKLGK